MKFRSRAASRIAAAAAAVLLAAVPAVAQEGVQVQQKSTFNMGRLGSGELLQTIMIRGTDRQKTVTEGRMRVLIISRDASGTDIVRLDEGKIYNLDTRRKRYSTQPIPDLRVQIESSQRELEAASNQPNESEVRLWVTDPKLERTGERRTINGFNTERVTLKLTVMGENQETNETGEVFFITSDMWIDPSQRDAARVYRNFYNAYIDELGIDPRTTANPFARWMRNLHQEMDKMEGFPILTHVAFEAPTEEQPEREREEARSANDPVGAAIGGLMRRAARGRQEEAPPQNPAATPGRALLFGSTYEVLSISLAAPDEGEFGPPADYRPR